MKETSMSVILNKLSDIQLIELLRNDAVGVMPTDTVYGLACRAGSSTSVSRLYGLKRRAGKPGTVIAASVEQLVELGLKRRYLKSVEQYWPGPLSVIIPCQGLTHIHLGNGTVAVRVVGDEQLRNLLSVTGPLLTSSANLTGQPPAESVEQAYDYFGDDADFYVDGGTRADQPPSTIIRIVDDAIQIIREGAVKINEQGKIT